MKNFLVIGNPIEHSLSPKLHNYWIKKHNINAIYEKKKLNDKELKNFFINLKEKKIDGVNVTVPFKKKVIPFLNKLTKESEITQSVNTIYFQDDIIIGHNTDVSGFELGIKNFNYDIKNKSVFILGAGGVVSSLIFSLKKLKVSKIIISNRTKEKAHNLKKLFKEVIVVDWGEIPDFDMIINATSLGLKNEQDFDISFENTRNDLIYIDIIYNPLETRTLKYLKERDVKVFNGLDMFIYQGQKAFYLWNKINPEIDHDLIELLLSKLK